MAERCVLSVTRPGDLALDPFCGSRSTGAIAVEHGREFLGFELARDYVSEATRRVMPDGPVPARSGYVFATPLGVF